MNNTKELLEDFLTYLADEGIEFNLGYHDHAIDYIKKKELKSDLLHSVSDMFSFAKYLEENYDYHDNTEDGDIYMHKGNKLKYTEDKIYLTWSNYR